MRLHARALPALVAAWYLGLLLSGLWPDAWRAPAGALALALSTGLFFRPQRAAVLLLAAALSAGLAVAPEAEAPVIHAGTARLDARVVEERTRGSERLSVIQIERGRMLEDGAPLPRTRLLLDSPLPVGARVRLLAKLRPFARFYDETPHPAWPTHGGIAGRARRVEGVAPRVLSRSAAADALEQARGRARRALERSLPADVVGVARALLLGEGGALDPEDRAHVRAAGLAHLMAVSGLHITLLLGLLVALWRALLSRVVADAGRWAALLGLVLASPLAAFAGNAPSAQRAALTAGLALGMRVLGRRAHAPTISAMAILMLTLWAPTDALSPALLLSVLATSALLGGGGDGDALKRLARSAGRALLATTPFTAYVFAQAPLLGWLVNVLVLPLFALVLVPLTWLHAGLALGLPSVAALTGKPLTELVRALLAASAAAASVGPASVLPPLSWAQGLVLAIACGIGLFMRRPRHGLVLLCLLVCALLSLEWSLRVQERPHGRLRATYLDIGQGDGAMVDLPDGELMMIDAGPREGQAPERVILPLLAARRRGHVDVFVLTHGHPDHYGGLEALLDAGVPIRELWLNRQSEQEAPGESVSRIIRRARDSGTRIFYPSELCGRPRLFAHAVAQVLAPCPGYDSGYDLNDNSLVLRIQYGRHRLLFTGDVEALAEHGLLRLGHALYADVLKVPHHGSRSSSTLAFLDLVRPRWAIVSCGRQNRFGHPHLETLARLRDVASYALRTDTVGGVMVETDGRALRITPTLPWPDVSERRAATH